MNAPLAPVAHAQVLVVEDDPDSREAFMGALESLGYRVLGAGDGLEALETLRAMPSPPSTILLDLVMPQMGGEEFVRRLQKWPLLAAVPVVVVSGRHDVEEASRALHARGFLLKPFSIDELRSLLPAP